MTVKGLYSSLEELIPSELSCDWDNDGLMLTDDENRIVERVLIALDCDDDTVEYAVKHGFDTVVTHHPLIFHPIKSVKSGRIPTLIKNGISVLSFHTRLDAVDGGVNFALAEKLGLENVQRMNAELGVSGDEKRGMTVTEYAAFVKEKLGCASVYFIPSEKIVRRVGAVGGIGGDFADCSADYEVFVTGEASYHEICDAADNEIFIFACGHYETEFPVCAVLEKMINNILPSAKTEIFENRRITTAV